MMDWNNIDLTDNWERCLNFLESYDFDTLLLEIECNLRVINEQTVKEQALLSLNMKFEEAKSILNSNLDNIVKQALKERNDK